MKKLKVLIAEDVKVIAETTKKELENIENIEILGIAENGQVEYDKIIELQPDLVLTDNQMPEMNGTDVIDLVNKSDLVNKPDFIMMTGDRDATFLKLVSDLGIYRVLPKPIDYSYLKSVIDDYIIEKTAIEENTSKKEELTVKNEKISIWKKFLKFLGIKK